MKPGPTILLLVLAAGSVGGCGQPQIGTDKTAFKAVDALYTAIGLRDSRLLDECDTQLRSAHDAGKLPNPAWESVASIIEEARSGKWESAQTRLSAFMEGQRR